MFFMLPSVAAQNSGIPAVTNIIARLEDGPRAGIGLALIDLTNKYTYWRSIYRVEKSPYKVSVYASKDPRGFKFGPSNVKSDGRGVNLKELEYKIIGGQPVYCLPRSGIWFLFVFPDAPVDVIVFIQRFIEGYQFFLSHNPQSRLDDLMPSYLGTLPAIN